MIAGDKEGIGLFVMMVDNDNAESSIYLTEDDVDSMPSLIDHRQFSDNEDSSKDESILDLVPQMMLETMTAPFLIFS